MADPSGGNLNAGVALPHVLLMRGGDEGEAALDDVGRQQASLPDVHRERDTGHR